MWENTATKRRKMVDSIELVHKDIETIIMTVFFMFKKLEEILNMLIKHMKE